MLTVSGLWLIIMVSYPIALAVLAADTAHQSNSTLLPILYTPLPRIITRSLPLLISSDGSDGSGCSGCSGCSGGSDGSGAAIPFPLNSKHTPSGWVFMENAVVSDRVISPVLTV